MNGPCFWPEKGGHFPLEVLALLRRSWCLVEAIPFLAIKNSRLMTPLDFIFHGFYLPFFLNNDNHSHYGS